MKFDAFHNIKLPDFEGSIENLVEQLQAYRYQWSDVQLDVIIVEYCKFLEQKLGLIKQNCFNYHFDLYGYLVERKSFYLLQKYQPVEDDGNFDVPLSPEQQFLELQELYRFKKISKSLKELYLSAQTQIIKVAEHPAHVATAIGAIKKTKILIPKKVNVVLLTKSFNNLVKRLQMNIWKNNIYVAQHKYSIQAISDQFHKILTRNSNKNKIWKLGEILEPFQFNFSVLIGGFVKLLEFINLHWIIIVVENENILLKNNYHVIEQQAIATA